MTNTAAASHTIARLAFIVLGAIAFMLGLGALTEAQAATPTAAPIIEAGIPEDHECVLRTADGDAYRVVADTDPRCKVQGQEAQPVRKIVVVPELSVIDTTPVVRRVEQGPADGAFRWETCAPEESPRGGHLVAITENGEAHYSDGYTIAPAKTVSASITGAVLGKWTAPRAQHA